MLDLGCRVLRAPQERLDLRDHKDQREILAFQGCQGLQDEQDLMERQDQKVQNKRVYTQIKVVLTPQHCF